MTTSVQRHGMTAVRHVVMPARRHVKLIQSPSWSKLPALTSRGPEHRAMRSPVRRDGASSGRRVVLPARRHTGLTSPLSRGRSAGIPGRYVQPFCHRRHTVLPAPRLDVLTSCQQYFVPAAPLPSDQLVGNGRDATRSSGPQPRARVPPRRHPAGQPLHRAALLPCRHHAEPSATQTARDSPGRGSPPHNRPRCHRAILPARCGRTVIGAAPVREGMSVQKGKAALMPPLWQVALPLHPG
jgi:hypothetical protein